MRRTEQVTCNILSSYADVPDIIFSSEAYPLQMVMRMISYRMSPVQHHLVDFRILPDIISYTKESSFYLILIQHIQDPRGNLRNRAIIKGKIYRLLFGGDPPDRPGKKNPVYPGRLLYKHILFSWNGRISHPEVIKLFLVFICVIGMIILSGHTDHLLKNSQAMFQIFSDRR